MNTWFLENCQLGIIKSYDGVISLFSCYMNFNGQVKHYYLTIVGDVVYSFTLCNIYF